MKRMQFLKSEAIALTLVLCLLSTVLTSNAFGSTQKNVILIMVDDQGYGDLSCHGNPVIKTPNLDRLHKESIRFTDFHVNPFCAPTRASLMTGKLSDRVDVRRTLNMRNYLPKEETTIANIFKSNGYKTGLFGKWHLGHNYPFRPIDRGFDEWFGVGDCGLAATSDYWNNDRFDDHYKHNGQWAYEKGFNTDVIFDRAIEYVQENIQQPFFIYIAPNVPHFPWNVKRQWLDSYRDKDLPKNLDSFYASIERVDQNIGRLRCFLDENNLDKNTIIVFLTDNGTAHFQNIYNANMRNKKGSVYEGGHRVPLFICDPSRSIGSPLDIDTLTAHFDILPTLAELCEIPLPLSLDLDGRSLVPLMTNEPSKWNDHVWVMHSQNMNEIPVKWESSIVLSRKWRLINGKELYDIKNDPSQETNVAKDNSEVVAQLRKKYENHWTRCKMQKAQPPQRPIIGSPNQQVVELGADAWMLDPAIKYIWWQGHVRDGKKANGYWPVSIAKTGTYRFRIRRWPEYIEAPIAGVPKNIPEDKNSDEQKVSELPPCKALAVKYITLKVNDQIITKEVTDTDSVLTFDIQLSEGPVDVRATLLDKTKKEISGAYYTYVRKLL